MQVQAHRLSRIIVAATAAAFLLLSKIGAIAAPLELKFGHSGGPGSLYEASAQEFARRANEKLQGVAHVVVYPEGKLGDDAALLDKARKGEIAFALVATQMSQVADEFGVFELPYLIRERDHVKRFRKTVLAAFLNPAAKRKGYFILGMWELGFQHIANNLRPAEDPASLKNMRVWVYKNRWRLRTFEAYGAKPKAIELANVNDALRDKKLDGMEAPLVAFYSEKFRSRLKYITLSHHTYSPAFLVTGRDYLASLPKEVQDVLLSTADEMQNWTLSKGEELDNSLTNKLAPTASISQADIFAFTIASSPIYAEFLSQFPDAKALVRFIFATDPHPFGIARALPDTGH